MKDPAVKKDTMNICSHFYSNVVKLNELGTLTLTTAILSHVTTFNVRFYCQFRRALGYMIARGQAQHLLKQRHYARPSAREAYQTAEDNHIVNIDRSRPKASMSGYARWWQNNFIPEGYGLYQQWMNGKNLYSVCMSFYNNVNVLLYGSDNQGTLAPR